MATKNTLVLTEALYISAYPIERPLLPPLKSGGGGYGSGGWGLSEGRPRGTGGPGRFNSHEPAVRRVLDDERRGTYNDAEQIYKPQIEQLSTLLQAQRNALKQQAISSEATPTAQLAAEQRNLTTLINGKRQQYMGLLPAALAFYGAIPFYKRTDSLVTRMFDPGAFSDPTTLYDILFSSVDAAYRLHIESESIRLLSAELAALAAQFDDAELQASPVNLVQAAARREAQIHEEQRICFESLPAYLQQDLINLTPNQDNVSLAEALKTYVANANHLTNLLRHQISAFSDINPEINSPLSKPQLEALYHLVDEQAKRRAGPLWAEYHQALTLNESIRFLQQFAAAYQALQVRAEQAAQLLARHLAEQETARLAAEAEHRAKEAEYQSTRYTSLGRAASATPLLTPIGGAAFDLTPAAYAALQHAIRRAVLELGAAAGATLTPIIVGALALAWPSNLGNADRQFSVSVPLTDLAPPEGLDLAAITASDNTLMLPYTLASSEENDGLHLLLTQNSSPIPVHIAAFDAERQAYSLALDNPSRILTWTPATAPGSEQGSSTSLPITPSDATIYTGSELIRLTGQLESYPALDLLELDRIIVTFPADSGLAPILVMFKDRRMEPGVVTGKGDAIEGAWLGDSTRGTGAVIPEQIAAQLVGQEFRNFNEFRKAFWKTVAIDAALSHQFSAQNLAAMRNSGSAPFPPAGDHHMSHRKYVLHHIVPISESGAVYDIDNIRIVTPKAHQEIHYGPKK